VSVTPSECDCPLQAVAVAETALGGGGGAASAGIVLTNSVIESFFAAQVRDKCEGRQGCLFLLFL
jgi:hypothetical protein